MTHCKISPVNEKNVWELPDEDTENIKKSTSKTVHITNLTHGINHWGKRLL